MKSDLLTDLQSKIDEDYKTSLKTGDKHKVSTYRLIKAAIGELEISLRQQSKSLDDDEIMKLFLFMKKQRVDSIEQFKKAGRIEIAEKEEKEIEIINSYLPNQIIGDELHKIVDEIMEKENIADFKDMGKAVNILKEKYEFEIDMIYATRYLRAKIVEKKQKNN